MSNTQELEFDLPSELYAREPMELRKSKRSDSRMIVGYREKDEIYDSSVTDITDFMSEGDLIVLNNSRTINAEFKGKSNKLGTVWIRLASHIEDDYWEISLRNNCFSLNEVLNEEVYISDKLSFMIIGEIKDNFKSMMKCSGNYLEEFEKHGSAVLAAYTKKNWSIDYYRNEYATVSGSLEMPAAGRHFTQEILQKIKDKGINIAYITLHSASAPAYIENERIEDHVVHYEDYFIPDVTAELISKTKRAGKKILGIGTTVTRTLESAEYDSDYNIVNKQSGRTELYIYEGYKFKVIDGVVTNFHGSRSSRLALAAAFVGTENIMKIYKMAIELKYMFYEFGDTTLLFN